MPTNLKTLIQTIKTGSPAEVKLAQRQVEKFWHDFYIPNRKEGQAAFHIFLDELKNFDQIKDVDHQAYFINTLKWPLWSVGGENFEVWADFLLENIQHPSGKIRQAVIHAADYLIMDIQIDLRDFGLKDKKITLQQKETIAKNRERFGYFVLDVEDLIDRNQEPRFKKYKFISSLPAGVYKSLNKLLVEALLRSEFYEKIYQDFLNGLRAKRTRAELPTMTLTDIWEGKKEAEWEIEKLIKATDSVLKLEDIKEIIFNENDFACKQKIIDNFCKDQSIEKLNKILSIIFNAWNYWPHKKLNGLSPAEKLYESQL